MHLPSCQCTSVPVYSSSMWRSTSFCLSCISHQSASWHYERGRKMFLLLFQGQYWLAWSGWVGISNDADFCTCEEVLHFTPERFGAWVHGISARRACLSISNYFSDICGQLLFTRDVHWFALIRELEANQADLPGSKANPNHLRYSRIKANPNQTLLIRFAS